MHPHNETAGPSFRWALLLLVLVTAAGLRLWQLGEIPPGLYRDEAYNGLDALKVLAGEHSLFFAQNNGREPLYIYLTALSVYFLGQTALAVRLGAAVIGIATTWTTYQLAATWFDRRTALLAAWMWAVTLWPVHLSRIGLRVILLPLFLSLFFWLGAVAYRRQQPRLWLLSGALYGLTFYTYLAARFTPLLLLLLLLYLAFTGRRRRLWPGVAWFILGTAVSLAPLLFLAGQQPDLVLGRSGQVSILNPAIHQGNVIAALWRHGGQALAMFFWQGDTIVRHNPAGRPLFDPVTAVAFIAGVVICLRHWRRPAMAALLLWTAVMLGPTILAEDTPHFLRAAGILPAVLLLPALALSQLWTWTKLPSLLRGSMVIILVLLPLLWTARDYTMYGREPDTAYLFESAARQMADQINRDTAVGPSYVEDERFWRSWPSLRFLINSDNSLVRFNPADGLSVRPGQPAAIYVWPYESLNYVPEAITPPALITIEIGAQHRGDLEPEAYPLYVRYLTQPITPDWPVLVNFDDQLQLRRVEVERLQDDLLQVDLYWSAETGLRQPVVAFIHVSDQEALIGQMDRPPGQNYWDGHWWRPGLVVHDRHIIELSRPYDAARQQLLVGVYTAHDQQRLPIRGAAGKNLDDVWLLTP